jgi:hypothetical protein
MVQSLVATSVNVLVLALSLFGHNALAADSGDGLPFLSMQSVQDYVVHNGSNGLLLYIDPTTGLLSQNQLVGTSTTIVACADLVVTHTNFKTELGEEVVGNFVQEQAQGQLHVSSYSFGNDLSLLRLEQSNCKRWSSDDVPLRLTTTEQ